MMHTEDLLLLATTKCEKQNVTITLSGVFVVLVHGNGSRFYSRFFILRKRTLNFEAS